MDSDYLFGNFLVSVRPSQTIHTDSSGRVVAGFPLDIVASRLAIVLRFKYSATFTVGAELPEVAEGERC